LNHGKELFFAIIANMQWQRGARYAKHGGERAAQGAFSTQFQKRTLPFVLREVDGRDC
jgi:hypothetical protein